MAKSSSSVLTATKKMNLSGAFLEAVNYSLSLISTLWSCRDKLLAFAEMGKFYQESKPNKCSHCDVFKPEVITSQGDIFIHSCPGGASQITVPPMMAYKQPEQIHSYTRVQRQEACFTSSSSPKPRGVQSNQSVSDGLHKHDNGTSKRL